MTIADLIEDAKHIGNYFSTWEIPLDKEVHLELCENQGSYIVKVSIKE